MSDKNEGGVDLSRLVSLIMENPKLISEISGLMRDKPGAEEKSAPAIDVPEKTDILRDMPEPTERERRSALLCALKPYVSAKRVQAIDSMITITEMIELMKAR